MNAQRIRLTIEERAQGVGFRRYIYRLARALDVCGLVRTDRRGVVEAKGPPTVRPFVQRAPAETPPGRVSGRIASEGIGDETRALPETLIAPDVTTCDDCLGDLFDPSDRRYRYPFVTCTNCGPRFSSVRGIPDDRSRTTMAGFVMCVQCQAEYEDPENRRFRVQPNACPVCGPQAILCDSSGVEVSRDGARDAIAAAAQACREGLIVAVKGGGGYHLACLARDERAVQRLRERTHRPDKPFAVMVADPGAAHQLVRLNIIEQALVSSRARPIVLARRRTDTPIAAAAAPRQRDLGVMLPSTPLHHLPLHDAGEALVMTSGYASDRPLVGRDEEARGRLAGIADLFLTHDRPIAAPTGDAIVRVVSVDGCWRPLMLGRPALATTDVVQHPHAHLAACLAEHGERNPAVGVIFDGTGCGPDGTPWGGEILVGDSHEFERVGGLRPVRMPGGDVAIREPWRMACAWLSELSPFLTPACPSTLRGNVDPAAWRAAAKLARSGVGSPSTTSVARLLDGIAALCGVCSHVSYEGQAAIELEMVAGERELERYDISIVDQRGGLILDPRAMVRAVARDLAAAIPVSSIAARVHNGLADAAGRCATMVAQQRGMTAVVLSGGVFQNTLLLERTAAQLSRSGLRVLIPERLPPNDGGRS